MRQKQLLKQNEALQRDLGDMVSLMSNLKNEYRSLSEENETYRQNFETLRTAHVMLQKSEAEQKALVENLRKQRQKMELEHDELFKRWKSELENKAVEFDSLREHLIAPSELEMLRVSIMKELEEPHQVRVGNLEEQLAKSREEYFNLKRENELIRTEFEQNELEHNKVFDELQLAHEQDVLDLKAQVRRAEASAGANAEKLNISNLNKTLEEFRVRNKSLSEEVSEIRSRLEQVNLEREDSVRRARMEVSALRKEQVEYQRERESLKRKIAHLEAQAEDLSRTTEALEVKLATSESAVAGVTLHLENEREDRKKSDALSRSQAREEEMALRAELLATQKELAHRNEQLQDLIESHRNELLSISSEQSCKFCGKNPGCTGNATGNVKSLLSALSDAENKEERLQASWHSRMSEYKRREKESEAQMRLLKSDKDRLLVQISSLQDNLKATTNRCLQAENEMSGLNGEIERIRGEYERSMEKLRAANHKQSSSVLEKERLEVRLVACEEERSRLDILVNDLRSEMTSQTEAYGKENATRVRELLQELQLCKRKWEESRARNVKLSSKYEKSTSLLRDVQNRDKHWRKAKKGYKMRLYESGQTIGRLEAGATELRLTCDTLRTQLETEKLRGAATTVS